MDLTKDLKPKFLGAIASPETVEANTAVAEFEKGVAACAHDLNSLPNAENFQMAFDVLYWWWVTGNYPEFPIADRDRLSVQYSRFANQSNVVQQQIDTAEEWAKDLEAAGLDPLQALSLAKLDCELEVGIAQRQTAITTSPSPIAIPQEIVRLYRTFYRAEKRFNPERTNVLKPLLIAKEVVAASRSTGEELAQEVAGRVDAFMGQVRRETAKGRWIIPDQAEQTRAVFEFARFIIYNVLGERFNWEKASFSSNRGIGLIEDACYSIYLLEQDNENSRLGGTHGTAE